MGVGSYDSLKKKEERRGGKAFWVNENITEVPQT